MRMRALQVRCAAREASIKHLRTRLEAKEENTKKYKKASQILNKELNDQKALLHGSIG